MTKISTKDWHNLPIERWNTNSFHAFLIEETARKFNGAEYTPGGKGSKSQRWIAEKGVLKRDIDKQGAEVVRKFIEICWAEYFTTSVTFKYPNYFFMISHMDRYWTQAIGAVAKERERAEIAERSDSSEIDTEWF